MKTIEQSQATIVVMTMFARICVSCLTCWWKPAIGFRRQAMALPVEEKLTEYQAMRQPGDAA